MKVNHLSLLLLLLCALCIAPAMAFSGAGSGTEIDPYQITTPTQFLELRDDTRGYFVLMNDLDMTGYPWSGTQTQNSIQVPGYAAIFSLDGQGHVVKNMVITRYYLADSVSLNSYFVGMFPMIDGGTVYTKTIKNILFESPTASKTVGPVQSPDTSLYVGIISGGGASSTATTTYINVGLVDIDVDAILTRSGSYVAQLTAEASAFNEGGRAKFYGCYVTGDVSASAQPSNNQWATARAYGFDTYGIAATSCYSSLTYTTSPTPNNAHPGFSVPNPLEPVFYDETKLGYTFSQVNQTARTTAALSLFDTFTGWDFADTWAMSMPGSPLEGMPVYKGVVTYAYIRSSLSIVAPATMGAYTSTTLEWEDLEPNSMATDYTFTIKDPDDDTVYSASTENGSYAFTPEEEGTWTVTYTCSDDTRTETITVTPSPSDLNITIPDHSLYLGESVVVSWADDNPHSSATDYLLSIAAPNTTVIYSSATDAGSYTITPDVTGAWKITFSSSDDAVQDQIGVAYESVTGTLDMTSTVIGGITPISWSFNVVDYRPDTGKPVEGYRLQLYEGDEANAMIGIGRLIATIPLTEETGNVSQMLTTVAGFSDTRPYFSGVLEMVDIDGGTLMIASDSYQGFFQIPSLVSAEPDEGFLAPEDLDDNAILITLNRGSLPAMLTTSSRLNITYATYIDTEWVYTSVYDELPDNEEYTLDTSGFPSTLYQRPLTFGIESNYDNTVSGHGEYAWVLMPMPVEPKILWKAPSSGNPITTAVERAPVALYVEPGNLNYAQTMYEGYEIYIYRYDPVRQTYFPFDVLENEYLPVMLSTMSTVPALSNTATLTFTETGRYKGIMFLSDFEETEPRLIVAEADITVTQNWLSPDTQADAAGGIFGIDGEAVKMVAGMLIVLGCAALPPLVFGNSHPMVILIGGVVGLVIGFALSLIPFWILLLLAIAAIAMVILNIRGGQSGAGNGGEE